MDRGAVGVDFDLVGYGARCGGVVVKSDGLSSGFGVGDEIRHDAAAAGVNGGAGGYVSANGFESKSHC